MTDYTFSQVGNTKEDRKMFQILKYETDIKIKCNTWPPWLDPGLEKYAVMGQLTKWEHG